jgi:uncharacterized surface protein with fasciclin (FAS1) repeats
MRMTHRLTGLAAVTTLVGSALLMSAPPATASQLGDKSLASLLLADGDTFDHNPYDYDILTQAVLAVLDAKPGSAVSVLADGKVPLTAFLPTDRAFKKTVHDLTGLWPKSEKRTFGIVASLGIDTVEQVLLYHVVPGATIDSATALASDGVALSTAAGPSVTVDVFQKRRTGATAVRLIDGAKPYPWLVLSGLDINEGNVQIAHRIGRVLLPPSS